MSGTYNLGRIGLKVCGAYSATEEYNYLDIVRYNGASYIAKESVTGILPTDSSYWELLAGSSIRVIYNSARQSVSFANSSEQTKLSYTLQEDGLYAVIANTQFPTGSGGTYRFSALKYTRNGGTNEIAAQTCPPQTGAGPRLSRTQRDGSLCCRLTQRAVPCISPNPVGRAMRASPLLDGRAQ